MSEGPFRTITLRSRGSVILGVVGMVAIGLLVVFSPGSGIALLSILLLMVAGCFVLLVRPFVRLDGSGVILGNPFRHAHLPWALIDDTMARWNLEVYTGAHKHTAWAISSRIDRPKGVGMFGIGGVVPRDTAPAAGSDEPLTGVSGAVTATRVARLIESASDEWRAAVRDGEIAAPTEPVVTHRVQWLDVAAICLPVIGVVVGLVSG